MKQSQTTEQRIIMESVKFIQQYGDKQLSLRKIASKMNMTTGAVYMHFKNKNELLERVAHQIYKDILSRIDLDMNQSPYHQLLALTKGLLELFESAPNEMNFIFFNSNLQNAYQNENDDLPFFVLIRKLTHQVNPGYLSDRQFFCQIWAFIKGNALLIKNGVVNYDDHLIVTTMKQITTKQEG